MSVSSNFLFSVCFFVFFTVSRIIIQWRAFKKTLLVIQRGHDLLLLFYLTIKYFFKVIFSQFYSFCTGIIHRTSVLDNKVM